ncbi:hypothetical protein ACKWME_01915 [Escherichia coli]
MIVSCIETIHANGESIPVEDLNKKKINPYSIIYLTYYLLPP